MYELSKQQQPKTKRSRSVLQFPLQHSPTVFSSTATPKRSATLDVRVLDLDLSISRALALTLSQQEVPARSPVAGVVLHSPFTSLMALVGKVNKHNNKGLEDAFVNEKKAVAVSCPTFVVHAAQDELIPAKYSRVRARHRTPHS